MKAVCVLTGNSDVKGVVHFTQNDAAEPVSMQVKITGLTPGNHGFHVHTYGDNTKGCISAGPHFNPDKKTHGDRLDSNRHVGDLGNVFADSNGLVDTEILDKVVSLTGPNSIIGRCMVIHALPDDLGRSKDNYTEAQKEESVKTGNAGDRVACGVIGLAE